MCALYFEMCMTECIKTNGHKKNSSKKRTFIGEFNLMNAIKNASIIAPVCSYLSICKNREMCFSSSYFSPPRSSLGKTIHSIEARFICALFSSTHVFNRNGHITYEWRIWCAKKRSSFKVKFYYLFVLYVLFRSCLRY